MSSAPSDDHLYWVTLIRMMVICKHSPEYHWEDSFNHAQASEIRLSFNAQQNTSYGNDEYFYKGLNVNLAHNISPRFILNCLEYIYTGENISFKKFRNKFETDIQSFKSLDKTRRSDVYNWAYDIVKREMKVGDSQTVIKTEKGNCSEEKIKSIALLLRNYNEKDDINNGLLKAENYYLECGPGIPILRWLFRFKLRMGAFEFVRKIIDKDLLPNIEIKPNIKQFTIISSAECSLREGIMFRAERSVLFQKISDAMRFLLDAPLRDRHYYYWQGRCLIEQWYINRNRLHLREALNRFNNIENIMWSVEFYRCIVLKLLSDAGFTAAATNHLYVVNNLRIATPSAALKTHEAGALILLDKEEDLKSFISKVPKPSTGDFESSLYHYIELIYSDDKGNKMKYDLLINTWLN